MPSSEKKRVTVPSSHAEEEEKKWEEKLTEANCGSPADIGGDKGRKEGTRCAQEAGKKRDLLA